jgi:hypothetical protein
MGRNPLFPCPENEGASTNTAEVLSGHRLGVVRKKGAGKRGWQLAGGGPRILRRGNAIRYWLRDNEMVLGRLDQQRSFQPPIT